LSLDGVLWQTGSPAGVFAGFGASAYFNGQPAPETLDVAMGHREVRRRLCVLCPSSPGVYGMVDRERKALDALLQQTFMERDRQAPIPFEKFDRVRLVASWFRQRPEERQKILSPEDAIVRCRTRARS